MTREINSKTALAIHTLLTKRTGGDDGLRDPGLLDAALRAPYQTFGGCELYPTVYEKAARLGHSLIANHAFVDGNKRIGMLLMLTFLKLNDAEISPSVGDVARVGFAVADGKIGYDELLKWILNNK